MKMKVFFTIWASSSISVYSTCQVFSSDHATVNAKSFSISMERKRGKMKTIGVSTRPKSRPRQQKGKKIHIVQEREKGGTDKQIDT